MIRFEAPYLRQEADRSFLCAAVTIQGQRSEAWFSVENDYAAYLTDDRLDAFVVGFLTTAMRLGEDIVCEAPLTKRLHYQLTTYLIPTMADNMEVYHPISIHAPLTEETLPCEKAVATGWTGGVDSMYTLMTHLRTDEPSRKLTHLLIANVGTLESDRNFELLQFMTDKARRGVAAQLGLSVVNVDSNIHLLQDELFLAVAAFRIPAAILTLQKLFGVYLNSSGAEFAHFAFSSNCSGYYELLPLSCFETDNTVFYSSGGHIPRIRKLEELSEEPYAQKQLHPCIYHMKQINCGRCGKCVRTMGALYALGKLDRFAAVFDVEEFYRNKEEYLAEILSNGNSIHQKEILMEMERRGMEISDSVRRKARIIKAATIVAQKNLKPKED